MSMGLVVYLGHGMVLERVVLQLMVLGFGVLIEGQDFRAYQSPTDLCLQNEMGRFDLVFQGMLCLVCL